MMFQALLTFIVSMIVLFAMSFADFGFVNAQPGISGIAIAIVVSYSLNPMFRRPPVPYFGIRV